MNNKGFTLIELIMVIAILAMLALMASPSVIKLIDKNKADNYNSTIDSIVEATELYVSNNRYKLNFNENCTPTDTKDIYTTITLQTLIDSKDITAPVKNFCTDDEISSNTKIEIILNCSTRQFSYDIDETTSENTLSRQTDVDGIEGLKVISCSDLY